MNEDETTLSISNRSALHPDADRPRRSLRVWLFHPRVVSSFLVALLLAGAPIAYRGWRISQVPDIELPYDTQPILDLVVPDEDNAWIEFRKAAAVVVPMDDLLREVFSRSVIDDREPIPPAIFDWAAKNQAALEFWKQATAKSDAQYVTAKEFDPYWYHGPAIVLHNEMYEAIRTIHDAAAVETIRLINQGQVEEAWDLCRMQFQATNLDRKHGGYGQGFMTMGTSNRARECVMRWMQSEQVSEVQLNRTLEELRNELRPRPWLVDAIRIRGIALNRLEEAVKASPRDFISKHSRRFARLVLFLNGEPVVGKRVQKLEVANFLQGCDLPPRDRPPFSRWPHVFDVSVEAGQKCVTAQELGEWGFASVIEPHSLVRYAWYELDLWDREQLGHEMLITAVAAEIFKRRNGEYPETLDQLVPEFLAEIPDNTFQTVPTPIVYRRDSAGAELSAQEQRGLNRLSIQLGKKRSKD